MTARNVVWMFYLVNLSASYGLSRNLCHLLLTWIGLNKESVLKTGVNDAEIQDSCLIIKKIISVRHLEEQGGSMREMCLQQNIFCCMN